MKVSRPTDVARTAELLFENRSIAEIKQFEDKTRKDIEGKKNQLKQLVGDSHSDVIGCTNQILAMATRCDEVIHALSSMQARLNALALADAAHHGHDEIRSPRAAAASKGSVAARAAQIAVGARVKFLLDTPEIIWGHLDAAELLPAAVRLSRAFLINTHLEDRSAIPAQASAMFPLVRAQWPQVAKLRKEIEDRARAALQGSHGLSAQAAAESLAALALLDPTTDHARSLQLLLAAGRRRVDAALAEASGAGAGGAVSDTASLLSSAALLLQDTLALAWAVFSGERGAEKAGARSGRLSALFLRPGAASDGFDMRTWDDLPPVPGQLAPGGRAAESDAWASLLEGVAARLEAPGGSLEPLRAQCQAWASEAAEAFKARAGQALGKSCGSAADLVALEAQFNSRLAAWEPTRVLPLEEGLPEALPGSIGASAPSGPPPPWAAISAAVLGRPLVAWVDFMEAPLLERAQAVVSALCTTAASDARAAIEQHLHPLSGGAAANSSGAGPREENGAANGHVAAEGRGVPSSSSVAPPARSPPEDLVVEVLGRGIRSAMAAVCDIAALTEAGHHGGAGSRGAAGTLSGRSRSNMSGAAEPESPRSPVGASGLSTAASALLREPQGGSRASRLAPHLQACVLSLVRDLSSGLEYHLAELGGGSGGGGFSEAPGGAAQAARAAIVLGRVCMALTSRATLLPAALGPHDRWPKALASPSGADDAVAGGQGGVSRARSFRAGAAAAAAAQPPPSEALSEAHSSLTSLGMRAFRLWSRWAASSLARELGRGLRSDWALARKEAPGHWARVDVGSSGDGSAAAAAADSADGIDSSVSFQLPAFPSPALSWVLLSASQELQAHLGAAVSRSLAPQQLLPAHQQYLWEVQGALLAALKGELVEGPLAKVMSDTAALQAIFDARFLRDALSGAAPPDAGTGPDATAITATALAGRRAQCSELEAGLSSRLDPIDWATYDPHLASLVGRALQRCSLLYGALVQCSRLLAARPEMARLSPPFECATMSLAPVAPRFAYLPVAFPGGAPVAQAAAALRGPAATSAAARAAAAAAVPDFVGQDSYADLFAVGQSLRWSAVRQPSAALGGVSGSASLAALSSSDMLSSMGFSGLGSDADSGALGLVSMVAGRIGGKAADIAGMAQQRLAIGLPLSLGEVSLPSSITSGITGGLSSAAGSFLGGLQSTFGGQTGDGRGY